MELIFHTYFPQMLTQNLNHYRKCVQNIQINSRKSLKTQTFQQWDIFGNHCHFGISSNQVFEISETVYSDKLNRASEHSQALVLVNIVYIHLRSLCFWTTLGSHIMFVQSCNTIVFTFSARKIREGCIAAPQNATLLLHTSGSVLSARRSVLRCPASWSHTMGLSQVCTKLKPNLVWPVLTALQA